MTRSRSTYVVTNTGAVPLRNIAVVDTTLGPVTCPSTNLGIGASMNCNPHTEVVTAPGPMFMEAIVTGVGDTAAPGVTAPIPGTGKGRLYSFTFVNGITISGLAPTTTPSSSRTPADPRSPTRPG